MDESLYLPLAASALDRDANFRDHPELFDLLWANEQTRVLPMFEGQVLLDSSASALRLLTVDRVPSAQLRAYLGKTTVDQAAEPAGSPVVLAVLSKNSADQLVAELATSHGFNVEELAWQTLRRSGVNLSARDVGLYTQGLALANWHQSHVHCPSCGTPTVIQQGGWSRRCFNDERQIFPRTDPAVIVSVIDAQDRILLGGQKVWESNRWSVLAGFVEPGESLDAAVVREVYEEAGIVIANPVFLGSQAWPFPYSLMLGFTAQTDSSLGVQSPTPDGEEIVRARWFSRAELAAEAPSMLLPSKLTIARALIDRWYGGEIPGHG